MKKVLFFLSLVFTLSFAFSQDLVSGNTEIETNTEANSESPFDAVKGKKEVISKRDLYSKHYLNEDGSYTALIGAGPIHYEKNGQFLDISHEIVGNVSPNYPYANKTNLFESYFGATASKGVKNKTAEGEVQEFVNTKMYWEVNGQATNTVLSAEVPVSIQDDKAYYHNLYGNISAEFITLTGKRKLNYIIPNVQDLGTTPQDAAYLVFSEDVVLPENWIYATTENGIVIKNEAGEDMYLYENPTSTDAANELTREENTVFETQIHGNVLTIKTKVKTEWLLSSERVFPVKVDPTVNVYPDNTTNWTRSVYDDGEDQSGGYFGYISYFWLRNFIKFNTTSIPSGITINSVIGYVNFLYGTGTNPTTRKWQFANSADPTTTSGMSLYNSSNLGYSNIVNVTGLGWRSSTLYNPQGNDYVLNSMSNNGYVAMSVIPSGSYTSSTYFQIGDHTAGSQRPYLTINYTVSSACSGTPTGGTASVSPSSGTHGTSYTASVSGSTEASGITYQWESAPSASGPWANVSGATAATRGFTAPYSNGTTYYRRKITCTNSNQSAYSSVTSFTTTCSPSHTNGNCASPGDCRYIGVSNVSLGTINNTTGYGNSSPAYNFYPAQTTDLETGLNYDLKVTYKDDGYPANPGEIGAWIDWNDDGDFNDANEFLGVHTNVSNNAQVTFNVNVPGGTAVGNKRLRVRSVFQGEGLTSSDACKTMQYGETEDYNVNILAGAPMTCATLSNLTPSLGTPENGLHHHLDLSWDILSGATGYDVQYSTNGTSYTNASPASVATNSYDFNAGDNPDKAYWFRVRAKNATETCAWTTVGPIYTAADVPEVPLITNAVGTSLDLTLQAETPVANPAHTTYSIYCTTTSQYVQGDGTLGATEVWQTKATWGTINVTGLTAATEYCFYAKAKNQDGHVVGGGDSLITEDFTTNGNFSAQVSYGPTNKWWTPGSPTSGVPMSYSSNGSDCSGGGGYVGFSGAWNNFHGTFLRSPKQNCTGMDEVVMTFDLSNSYFSNHPNDKVTFNMWAPTSGSPGGTYINATSVNGQAGNTLLFSEVRSCKKVTVVYDLASVTDKSEIMFYLNFSCGYNNSNLFYYKVDNITLSEGSPTACATLMSASTPVFHDYGSTVQLAFNNSKINQDEILNFRLSHPVVTAINYELEINTASDFSGTSYTQTFSGTYPANTERNFVFTNASGLLNSGTTYYVRARIQTAEGYGAWTTKTYSFTYDSSILVTEWFQQTTPQFITGVLDGTVAHTNPDYITLPEPTGTLTNPFANPSFETDNSNWGSYKTGGSELVVNTWDGGSWQSDGSRAGRMYMYGGYAMNSDVAIISQTVDLTGVEQIVFDAQSHYGQNMSSSLANGGTLRLIIGGTTSNTTGTTYATVGHCTTGTSGSCTQETLDITANIPPEARVPGQLVKFVWTGFSTGDLGGALIHFMVDNVRGTASGENVGTIISPVFHLSSVPTQDQQYNELYWNQELHSSIVLAMQHYNVPTQTWQDVSGYDNISLTGDGDKSFDLSSMTVYDSVRVKATLTGTNTLKMFNWGIKVQEDMPLPVELINFVAVCEVAAPLIKWSTASERNSESFVVETSTDGTYWEHLKTIPAAGNSSTTQHYAVRGIQNQFATTYYRLIQRDFDGAEKLYGPISSNCEGGTQSFVLFPNPNKGDFQIVASSTESKGASLSIFDVQGRAVYQKSVNLEKGENWIGIDANLHRGVYMVQLKDTENSYRTVKMIVE